MYRDFFARSPLLALPMLALGIFLFVFVSVVVRALSSKNAERFALASRLPLESDDAPQGESR